jgi:ankyrin repeat protein
MTALLNRHWDIAMLLLKDYNVDPNKTYSQCTPLHIATKNLQLEIVKVLISKGAHVNRVDTDNGKTALHMAVELRHYDIVDKLLDSGGIST